MKINKDQKSGYNYMTSQGRVISNSKSQGLNDSLGRTAIAAEVYDEDRKKLIEGVKSYFSVNYDMIKEKSLIHVTRWGDAQVDYLIGTSRDHILKAISIMHRFGEHDFVKNFLKHRAKRPGMAMPYTPDQKVWLKALYSKPWTWVYFALSVPWLLFALAWNKALFKIGKYKFHKQPSVDVSFAYQNRTKLQDKLNKIILPAYGFFYTAYMVRELPVKFCRKWLGRLLGQQFEKSNYFARWLCGYTVPQDVDYIPSRKNRWSVYLNESCDRDMRCYTEDTAESNIELACFDYAKNHKQ